MYFTRSVICSLVSLPSYPASASSLFDDRGEVGVGLLLYVGGSEILQVQFLSHGGFALTVGAMATGTFGFVHIRTSIGGKSPCRKYESDYHHNQDCPENGLHAFFS